MHILHDSKIQTVWKDTHGDTLLLPLHPNAYISHFIFISLSTSSVVSSTSKLCVFTYRFQLPSPHHIHRQRGLSSLSSTSLVCLVLCLGDRSFAYVGIVLILLWAAWAQNRTEIAPCRWALRLVLVFGHADLAVLLGTCASLLYRRVAVPLETPL